jgi:spore maturation protein SpmB
VLAVYFGSIGISRSRHAVPAALCADAAGLLGSLFICRILL